MRVRFGAACLVLLCVLGLLFASVVRAQNPFWPYEDPPRPLPAREVKFPPYEVRTLANGMQVLTVLHHEQPAVTMHLLVRAGAAQDPAKKEGVAFLAAQLLDQGTTTRTANQIADQIDSIGGSLGVSSQQDRTIASAVVMKDSFDFGMNLIADVAHNPSFDPGEIERQKEQIISLLRVNAEDPDYIANIVFDRLVYGFHPYGLPGSGTPDTIASITRDDLRAFHRRYFVPNNMILAIVGDVTGDEAFSAAQRVFGSWTRAEVPPMTVSDPPRPTRRVVVIDKPDAVQTEIRAGQLAIARKHPDHLAWDLAVRILGGEGANRLHRVLRSERGLTYGASAEMEARKQAGDFVAETDTRTETTGEALRLMKAEMVKLQDVLVSPRELGDAQAYLAGSFPLTIETPNDIAVQVLNAVFYELPLDEIGTFHTRVVSVTPADVQRVARQYIQPDNLSIVLVGNAKAFVSQLRDAGFREFEVIPLSDLDLSSATLKRERRGSSNTPPVFGPARPAQARLVPIAFQATRLQAQNQPAPRPAAPASPAGKPQQPRPPAAGEGAASELLRRVIDARGGLTALRGVRSVVAETETTFMDEQGKVAATTRTRTYVVYPDKFRVDASIQGDLVSQIYNAGRAWERSPAGVRDLPPQIQEDASASVKRDTIPLLVAAADGRVPIRAASEGGLRVLEIGTAGPDQVRLFVDDQMLIVKQQFNSPVAGPRQEESFSDYRQVGGLRVPFQAFVSRDGRVIVKRTLTKISFNETIDPAMFERPADTGSSPGPANQNQKDPPANR
ncbi:MAG TPA: pitrilysin family protein [Vicinamibacterales bacterium]|nr:pitrilysin family protein [Vicinamibacterales bacterium]